MSRVLWIPHVNWRTPQRPHFFAPHFRGVHDLHVTNWDASFNSISSLLSRRSLLNLIPRTWTDDTVTVHHVPRLSPALPFSLVRHVNERIYQSTVEHLIERHHIEALIGTFVTPPPSSRVHKILDLFDDNPAYWLEQNLVPEYAQDIQKNEDLWADQSRYIVCVSTVLRDRCLQERGYPEDKLRVIPNGVDLDTYVPADNLEETRLSLGLEPDYRYVGVIGSINKTGEVERILRTAKALKKMPKTRLIVVGSGSAVDYLNTESGRQDLPVIYAGFHQGDRLLRYFQSLDIGLCPYTVTRGSDAICPMRLLHYSATGATVVSTGLAEVRRMRFSNVVISDSDDADIFASRVMGALESDRPHARPDAIGLYDANQLANTYNQLITGAESPIPNHATRL